MCNSILRVEVGITKLTVEIALETTFMRFFASVRGHFEISHPGSICRFAVLSIYIAS